MVAERTALRVPASSCTTFTLAVFDPGLATTTPVDRSWVAPACVTIHRSGMGSAVCEEGTKRPVRKAKRGVPTPRGASSATNRRAREPSTVAHANGLRQEQPGEILREEYLKPLEMSANALAKALKVPASRINDIVLERRGVTVDTAMRLVRYFGGDVQTWMNLQTAHDIKVASKMLAKRVEKEIEPLAA